MIQRILLSLLILVVALTARIEADTPANCMYEDIRGEWIFYEGPRDGDSRIDCDSPLGKF